MMSGLRSRGGRRVGPASAINRFRSLGAPEPEIAALLSSLEDWRADLPGTELLGEVKNLTPRILLSGWAARIRTLPDGRRQIIGFLLAGDAMGLSVPEKPVSQCRTVALTPVQTLDATPVRSAILSGLPIWRALASAVATSAITEETSLIENVVRLGRLTAHERISHLILELSQRARQVGLGSGPSTPFPLTQDMLADATGLSVVHVNRILQQLKRDGMASISRGLLRIDDRPGFAEAVGYGAPVD